MFAAGGEMVNYKLCIHICDVWGGFKLRLSKARHLPERFLVLMYLMSLRFCALINCLPAEATPKQCCTLDTQGILDSSCLMFSLRRSSRVNLASETVVRRCFWKVAVSRTIP